MYKVSPKGENLIVSACIYIVHICFKFGGPWHAPIHIIRIDIYSTTLYYVATLKVKLPNFKLKLQLVSLSSLSGFFPPPISHPLYNNFDSSVPHANLKSNLSPYIFYR